MRILDLQSLGLDGESYSITAVHNTSQTIKTGIVANKTPFGIVVNRVAFAPGEYLIGYTWTLSANNEPIVTLLYSASVTRDAQITVLYQT